MLEIAGPDEAGHASEIRRLVRENGLQSVVHILGPIEPAQKSAVYGRADLLVLPTHSESFGMVVAEAMAHAVPVLTTKGAPWAIVTERHCGWWVDISVAGIAEGLHQATTCNPAELKAMGRRGRELVRSDFGWEGVASRMLKIYEKTVSVST
jgi:glycosyltransferase involved in cell wall biosynthesis